MIDTHFHLWKYNTREYPWLEAEFIPLRRDFLMPEFIDVLAPTEVTGVVPVQARSTMEETDWLLDLADQHRLIRGVVGWAPLKDKNVGATLDRLRSRPAFKGMREILSDYSDAETLTNDDFNRGIRELTARNLTYDLLIDHLRLPVAIEFVDRHPEQVFIVDHIAGPEIRKQVPREWDKNLRAIAQRPNVFCKVSGMATVVKEPSWDLDLMRPYFNTVLEAFSPRRLMFGSDWPVCLPHTEYQRWLQTVKDLIAPLSSAEQDQISHLTAEKAYHL